MGFDALTDSIGAAPTAADLIADLESAAAALAVPVTDATSVRTRAAYAADWRQWEAWCDLHERAAVPVDPALVRLYVADLATSPRAAGAAPVKTATIERHLAAIAWHSRRAGGIHDLVRHPLVAPVLAGARQRGAERPRPRRALLDADVVRVVGAMAHHTWPDGVLAARDTFALLLARAARLRRSQVASLTVADVLVLDVVPGTDVSLCMPCARTRWLSLIAAADRPRAMGLVFETGPVAAWSHVDHDLPRVGDLRSPVFRAVSRTARIEDVGLTDSGLAQMFKRRVEAAGLDATRYGFDSLRVRP